MLKPFEHLSYTMKKQGIAQPKSKLPCFRTIGNTPLMESGAETSYLSLRNKKLIFNRPGIITGSYFYYLLSRDIPQHFRGKMRANHIVMQVNYNHPLSPIFQNARYKRFA
jgi:hypothetical protein